MPRSRVSAALYLILVFASGIIVGTVGHRLYSTTTASASTLTPDEWKKRYLEQMKKRVGASPDQLARVTAIMNDTKRKFDDVHAQEKTVHDKLYAQQVEDVRAVFADEKQKAAFEVWRAERKREREKAQKKQ